MSSRLGAKPQERRSSPRRKKSWNCTASDGAGSPIPADAPGAARIVSPPRRNDPDVPGTPVANCGTTRYSRVEGVPLAGKTVHPESSTGSIDRSAATANTTESPLAVHGRRCGSVPPLQAAIPAANSQGSLRDMPCIPLPLRYLSGAPQSPLETERPGYLVHTDHCDEQGFERDIRFGKRAPQQRGESDGQPSLRDQAQPSVLREV